MLTHRVSALWLCALALVGVRAHAQSASSPERFVAPPEAVLKAEPSYWRKVSLPIPDGIVLEVSGILAVPDKRLLVTTRRGEIWWVDGAYDYEEGSPAPRFTLFASGLHEPLGIAAAPTGGYYVAQRGEITRLVDQDNDGRADRLETVWKIPLSGSYHEYAFGPVVDPATGNLRVALNVAFDVSTQSPVPWRGWMVEVTPDGRMTPIAAGLRSPAGFTVSSKGTWLFADNQGEWVGSGYVSQIEPGDFLGHPASLAWSDHPGSPVRLRIADIPDSGEPLFEVAKRLPGLKPPAVWFPYTVLGISTSDIREDVTAGRFGPFADQFYVGDQGQSRVMRMSLEKVRGVWQGAAYPFRAGFDSGVLRLTWGEDGSLFVGETNRGWSSVGRKPFGLERLVWTGRTPFEIGEVKAQPDGFTLKFTQPVDRKTASDPASYRIAGFTYKYHSTYGSTPINRLTLPIDKIVVAPDRLSVRLAVSCLREGYVHEIRARDVRAATSGPADQPGSATLLHDTAYYTLNRIPQGAAIAPQIKEPAACVPAVPPEATASTPKHTTEPPKLWRGVRVVLVRAQPGLKFDTALITVRAGDRIRFVLQNEDDMMHNLVITRQGRADSVAQAALQLGVEGLSRNYVPESDDVLVHTALLEPGTSDTIYFIAPEAGTYEFICTFPGHFTMRGILKVEAP